jgi:hypothetical protein
MLSESLIEGFEGPLAGVFPHLREAVLKPRTALRDRWEIPPILELAWLSETSFYRTA